MAEFAEFNLAIAGMDSGIALLKTLMAQYRLGVADLPELGSKSNVSKLLNAVEGKKLNRHHIEALSHRFGAPVSLFFQLRELVSPSRINVVKLHDQLLLARRDLSAKPHLAAYLP